MEGKLKPSFRIAPWHRPLSAFLALALLLFFSGAGAGDKSARELFGARKDMALGSPGFSSPRFSPDGKLVAFDVCDKSRCENAIYDIANDRYFAYRDKQGRRITNVSFSPSGRKLTFVVKGQKAFCGGRNRKTASPSARRRTTGLGLSLLWKAQQRDTRNSGARKRCCSSARIRPTPDAERANTSIWPEWTAKPYGHCSKISTNTRMSTRLCRERDRLVSTVLRVRDRFGTVSILCCRITRSAESSIPSAEQKNVKLRQDEVLRISIPDETVTLMPIATTDPYHPAPANVAKRLYIVSGLRDSAGIKRYVHDVFVAKEGKAERVSQLAVYIYGMDVSPDGTFLALVVPTPDRSFTNGRLLLYDTRNHSHRELKPKAVSELPVHIDG